MKDPGQQRLDSWKEIAAFFGRDDRTVRRWEKERALPVHRMPGKARGSVYAYPEELMRWLNSAPPLAAGEVLPGAAPAVNPATSAASSTEADSPASEPEALLPATAMGKPRRHWPAGWMLAVLAAFAVLAAVWGAHLWQLHSAAAAGSQREHAAATHDREAEDFYLKGRYAWNKRTVESLNLAVDMFTQAIVRDPNYAQAYAGLAETYDLLREYSSMPEAEAYSRALAASRRAVELDPSLAEAHRALAFCLFNWQWDLAGSEREYRRALELNPQDATAHHWYATSLLMTGRYHEAREQIELARQLDPGSASIAADRAIILARDGQTAEAKTILRQIERTEPSLRTPHYLLAVLSLEDGNYAEYLREAKIAAALKQNYAATAVLEDGERAYRRGGKAAMWQAMLRTQKQYYARGEVDDYDLAATCARMNNMAESIRYLTADFEKHDPRFIGILSEEPFRTMHKLPEFRALAARARLPVS